MHTWIHGYLDTWILGYMDISFLWIHGYLDTLDINSFYYPDFGYPIQVSGYFSILFFKPPYMEKRQSNSSVNPKRPGLLGGVLFGEMKFVLSNFLSSEDLSISYES
jgi:hypothetical protein